MKVLFCADGSSPARKTADILAQLPFPEKTELTILAMAWSAFGDIPDRFALEVNEAMKDSLKKIRTMEAGAAETIIDSLQTQLSGRFPVIHPVVKGGDPAQELSSGVGLKGQSVPAGDIYDALMADDVGDGSAFIVPTNVSGLFAIPADRNLAGAETELVPMLAREARLRRIIAPLRDRFDYILIDCPPSLGLLTLNALVACDAVLIPLPASTSPSKASPTS